MQSCIIAIVAFAVVVSHTNAQMIYSQVGGASCQTFSMYGTQTISGTVSALTLGASNVGTCQYCNQGSFTGTYTTTTTVSSVSTTTSGTTTGTIYFCTIACPNATGSVSISYNNANALPTIGTGIYLTPQSMYALVSTLGLPGVTASTATTGSLTVSNINCYKAAAWKLSVSLPLLVALLSAVFFMRKN